MCNTYHLGQECRLSTTDQLFVTRSRSPHARRLSQELQSQRFALATVNCHKLPSKLADSNDPTTRDFPKNEQYIPQKMTNRRFSWRGTTNVVTTLRASLYLARRQIILYQCYKNGVHLRLLATDR
jgi:hypothetical protein